MTAYGPPGGGTPALLAAVASLGAPPAGQDDNDSRRAVVDVYAFGRIGGKLPPAPLTCESCDTFRVPPYSRPAEYVVILPGAMRVAPFLVCAECRP